MVPLREPAVVSANPTLVVFLRAHEDGCDLHFDVATVTHQLLVLQEVFRGFRPVTHRLLAGVHNPSTDEGRSALPERLLGHDEGD